MKYGEMEAVTTQPFEHYHDAYELNFYLTASLSFFVKDINYPLQSGDIIFIDEYDLHKVGYESGKPYVRYGVNFSKTFFSSQLREAGVQQLLDSISGRNYKKISLSPAEVVEMKGFFQEMYSIYLKSDKGNHAIRGALLQSCLFVILNKLDMLMKKTIQPPPYKKGLLVQQVIHYIDESFGEKISLEEMAGEFGINKFHLSRVFKETTGFTIWKYLQSRRVIESQSLMKKPDADIERIYIRCGFSNLQHFYRVFKKISGMAPGEYMKNQHGKPQR
ncbi:MAG: AraC family transcriptional regulator [Christensenellales bacterium]